MTLEEDMRILSGVDLFRTFSREQLRLLAFGAETLSLPAGRKLFAQGAIADCAFVIVAGEVALYWEAGEQVDLIAIEGRGAILGGLALIAEGERLTGASAHTPARLVRLNRSAFMKILQEFPELAVELHQRISADLNRMLAMMTRAMTRFED